MSETVGIKLLSEIERVSALRERYRTYARDPAFQRGSFEPAIYLMTSAIDAAKEAITGDDPVASINALDLLASFDSNA